MNAEPAPPPAAVDAPNAAAGAPPGPARPPPKARYALLRSAWGTVLATAVLVPLLLAALLWGLLGTTAGSAWLLGRLPGLQVAGVRGTLLGPAFGADAIRWSGSGALAQLSIEGLQIDGLAWRWWLGNGVWAGLEAASVQARRVSVRTGPASGEPLRAPASLRLPVQARLESVAVGELRIDEQAPVLDLGLRLHVGADDGRSHVAEAIRLQRDRIRLTGRARITTEAPFPVEAEVDAAGDHRPPWQARLRAQGPLQAIDLQATLRGEPLPGHAPATLDAAVQLRPFEAWPLGRLTLQTAGLDLAAFASGAPATRLSGRASIDSAGRQAPLEATLELVNAAPGAWSSGRLPVRQATVRLRAVPAQPGRLDLSAFELQFADAAGSAGAVRGSGSWDASRLALAFQVDRLRPRRLDARAPAMVLSGPLTWSVAGLPSPDPRAASASASASAGAGRPATLTTEFSGKLEGALEAAPRPVSLSLQGRASRSRLQLDRVEAASGGAKVAFALDLQQTAAAGAASRHWQLRSNGRVDGFDPVPWFPGPEGSAWRRGPHRLNGQWTLDLALPAAAGRAPPLQVLQMLQGSGRVELADSRLAGVPVQAVLQLDQDPAAPPLERSHARGELRLASNVVRADGRGDPAGSGEADRLRIELDAPQLAELGPLVALAGAFDPEAARWAPTAGRAQAGVTAEGRWPDLRTEGQAQIDGLQAGPAAVDRAQAQWRLHTGRDQPLVLQADLAGAAFGATRVTWAHAEIDGRLTAHRIRVDAAAPARPPEGLERALGLATKAGTRLQLEGSGSWERERGIGAAGEGQRGWRGGIERLAVGHWDGRGDRQTPADGSWLDARGLRGEVRFDADWRLVRLQADAGSAALAGGMPLRWDEVRYVARERGPEFTLRAEAGPTPLAPFMQRAMPGAGWSGDLQARAVVDIRAGERLDADIRIERTGGDLQTTESGVPHSLGLTEASLVLAAHDGQWHFTPLLVGRSLGTLTGSVTVRTGADRRWPDARAPIEGALHVAVPDIAIWSGWVPPGWRLQGEVSATALVEGRFDAPEYTGELRADGVSVRNLLQGVALTEGRMLVALKGETARVEYFSVRGGDGVLTAEGEAAFGDRPTATLRAQAKRFRVLGRVDRLIVASGEATLKLAPEGLRLDGSVKVDNGLFDLSARDAPGLDDDVSVLRDGPQPAAATTGPAPARSGRNVAVAVDVDLGDDLRLRGRGLDALLKGQLRITTPGGRLAIDGSVRTEKGTYAAYGQKLDIERGVIVFRGPADSAELDIVALRPNTDIRVGINVTGTTLNPRVRLFSDPEMSETEKLSWLMMGRGSEGLGRNDTGLLQSAAMALVAGEGETPTGQVLGTIGLDTFSVSQTDGDVRETVVTVGKQLSRRWYVGYERSVNATTGTWQLIYRIAQRFTLRAQSGEDNSLDLIWTWRFNKVPGTAPLYKRD